MKKGDLMFKIVPALYKARYEAEKAEAEIAELEYNNTKKLFEQSRVASLRMRWPCSRPNWPRPRPSEIGPGRIELYQCQGTFRRHRRPPARAAGQPGQGGRHPHDLVR